MKQLVVVIVYNEENQVAIPLFEAVSDSECQLMDISLSATDTSHKIATLTLSGHWSQLKRFKTRLSLIEKHYNSVKTILQEINGIDYPSESLPYQVYINTLARPNTLYQITHFFINLPIRIQEMSVSTYQASITHTSMLEVSLILIIPPQNLTSDYRETILHFCDLHNFEVTFESKRT